MPPSLSAQRPLSQSKAVANPIHPNFLERLDKDFIEFYNNNLGRTTPDNSASVEEVRKQRARYHTWKGRNYRQTTFVEDIKLEAADGHSFTVRLYKPDPRTSPYGAGPYPVHVNFHGEYGSLESSSASERGYS
jgi:hypothetical protein